MKMRMRFPALRLAATTVVAAAVLTPGTGAAAVGACGEQTTERPFLRFLDPLAYTLVPGGDFEGSHGWTLTGGARIMPGNEPYLVGGRTHQRSLYLPRGATATSPSLCAGIAHPTLRFFATGGSLLTPLRIEAVATDPLLGLVHTMPLVHPLLPFWVPSLPLPVATNLGGVLELDRDGSSTTQVSFRFSNPGGPFTPAWRVDDVYLDPWVIR
jgi:hypothetical protein